jgi:hypothetical protein
MDAERFDSLLRSVATSPSRRSVLRLLAGSALGGLLLRHPLSAEAKKKGGGKKKCKSKEKVTICHKGQTMRVSACAVKGHKKHGDSEGECPSAAPPCQPKCGSHQCGSDDCGGSCGPCPARECGTGLVVRRACVEQDGTRTCQLQSLQKCGLYACRNGSCLTQCSTSNDCVIEGECVQSTKQCKAANGQSCGGPQDCASGYCVGNVCCNSVCTSGNAAGTCSEGTCDCTGNFQSCNNDGACDCEVGAVCTSGGANGTLECHSTGCLCNNEK